MSTERARLWYASRKEAIRKMYWGSGKESGNLYLPSGFKEYPREIYNLFLSLIHRSGKVLDLGCGNGLLLRHLVENSRYELEPFGVDFIEESIRQARELVLPAYSSNLTVSNIVEYELNPGSFDFIFVDPTDIHRDDIDWFLDRVVRACKPGGRIIFYTYRDVMRVLFLLSLVSLVLPFLRERLPWRIEGLATWVGKLLPRNVRSGLKRIDHKHVSIGIYDCRGEESNVQEETMNP